MGQFEYSVGIASIKPEDIPRVAKEYLENKEREESGTNDDQDHRSA
jgi:hypothetical protein